VKTVRLSTDASVELAETVAFYEKHQTGLGAAFVIEFEKSVQLIQHYPESGRPIGNRFRRVLTNRFPYALIYIERDEEFFVIAVAHTSRRPGYWKDRLTDC
jgi:plasmid stabilization system protein ParE